MTTSRLSHALNCYEAALNALKKSASNSSKDEVKKQVIAVLIARDRVQAALTEREQIFAEALLRLRDLDNQLEKQAHSIAKTLIELNCHRIVNPPTEAWWWFLDPAKHPWQRFDWLWSTLSVLLFTITLGLLTDISSRFLSGGPDTVGSIAVVGQSVLTLLAGGGAFTKVGQNYIESILVAFGSSKTLWQWVSRGFAAFIFLGVLGLHSSLKRISTTYSQWGVDEYNAGRLSSAQANYERALKLYPDNPYAHFGLGVTYEDLQQFGLARREYQIAMKSNLAQAYNNLSRLYILDKKYDAAVSVLLKGLNLPVEDAVKYKLQKNLGWARLEQKRYGEANAELQEALSLVKDPVQQASVRCLLAQVLEGQGEKKSAMPQWQACLQNASSEKPEEDKWIDLARQRLQGKGAKR
jgi:tetratricopeptide (TPR) repeat protein